MYGSVSPRTVNRARSSSGKVAVPASIVATAVASALAWLLTSDWIAAAALWVLWAGWHWLGDQEGPPVLPLAFTFQWVQVTAGLYYYALSGRRLLAMDHSDYQPMVLIGLGCLIALLVGIRIGRLTGRWWPPILPQEPVKPFAWGALVSLYVVLLAVTGPMQALAWELPAFTQAILALTYFRLALLFMMFWGLAQRRLGWFRIVLLLVGEIVFGFTGYYAGFREPLMMAAVALMGVFDARRLRHWFVLGLLLVTMFVTGLMWLGIRTGYREEFENEVFAESRAVRAERLFDLSSTWVQSRAGDLRDDLDSLVERLWVVYFPALAVSRVPSVLPHEDGELLWRALRDSIQPRVLFPDKGILPSDSEMVIRYSGVWVAGAEQNTSIAFGYAAESYVDFGVPLMFLPVLLWGVILGAGYQALLRLIHRRELAIAVVTVIFWLSLYLFERSWTKTFGTFATLTIYLGGAAIVADRILLGLRSRSRRPRTASATPRAPVAR
jgi:hypothetical protein